MVGEHRPQPGGQGRRRRPGAPARRRGRPGRRWRSPGRSLATIGVPAAMASSSTTPNDSPLQRRRAEHVGAVRRSTFSRVARCRPSHSMRTSPATWRRSAAVSGPSPPTQSRISGGQLAPSPRAARRGPCGARGGRRRRWSARSVGPGGGLGVGLQLDAVEDAARSRRRRSGGPSPGRPRTPRSGGRACRRATATTGSSQR